ncbi:helix-turn-helix domain-containing GNAT family N-acetyltransferase [Nocardioides panacisoli]|uniref:helix-turn-helix domain-containing GNAT family N-acetyltransferase n=1 Tax=Nocardioides panacisoli TaxID=627624 RepID=UPI001C631061|nr:helix-turn-helix domain-containing GNAT family N-acetyltransferase [Nocardioides panacisoli]QYJ04312.1 helix-turn-helix domain-containing GNAT family N-acetyltransferase [Nocardioides panacisoli]
MESTAVLRRFNRTYTQRIGVLEESFLGTGRPLAVNRVLFEVGADEGTTVRRLREHLGLDSGHLSRLLRRLEGDRLVSIGPDPVDARRRVVHLTADGRAAVEDLDRRSEDLAVELLSPLTERQRTRLSEALATADLLVRAATVELRTVPPDDAVAREATRRYVAELAARFPAGFEPDGPEAAEPGATYVVATSGGAPVAHGGIRPLPDLPGRTAELKRMWVDAEWRGAGLGARMLRHLEALAQQTGHDRVVLDTNATLTEAIDLYERMGYRRTERYNDNPYADHFFERTLP